MIFVVPTIVAVVWLLVAQGGTSGRFAKPLASLGFVSAALVEGALDTDYGRWILAGLVLGLVGDVALMFERWFLTGLVVFATGHVAYVVAFVTQAPPTGWALATGGLLGVGSLLWLRPHLAGVMTRAVPVYVLVISLMVAAGLSVGDVRPAIPVGAGLFAASDLFVARERFVAPDRRNRLVGLPLYYAGQLLIALSV